MSSSLATLESLPSVADFYALYWNRKPFLVRDAVDRAAMDRLITPDELAGLSMEETVRSRMVSRKDWACRFGPFTEDDFATSGQPPWSLLVQNVEQFHPDTADLLRAFSFAPRWLIDDIMVSFSTEGGTIGGHVDSYHVFLVQGQGRRRWTIGHEPVFEEDYIDGLDLKILKEPVEGDVVDVTSGDVLYVPLHFAHEGTTLEDALAFSVGFLGPKLSELYDAYGLYMRRSISDIRATGWGRTALVFCFPPMPSGRYAIISTTLWERLPFPSGWHRFSAPQPVKTRAGMGNATICSIHANSPRPCRPAAGWLNPPR